MREIMKLGLILLVIAVISAAILGVVNDVTKGPIEAQMIAANNLARQEVLSEADAFEMIDLQNSGDYPLVLEVYEGKKDGTVIGYTLKTNPGGYSGEIEVMIGVSTEAVITGVKIGNHTETPGLGAKASDHQFRDQYMGKDLSKEIDVIKAGTPADNEIVAIAGATISSKAVTSGVNEAIRYFNAALK